MEKDLIYYINEFEHLNTNVRDGKPSPHKPILLLSIINLIEVCIITDNKIELNDDLNLSFAAIWREYVDPTLRYNCNIALPYFYMDSESFWKLKKSKYYEEKRSYTEKDLKANFDFAVLDEELFDLIKDPSNAIQLRVLLITKYIAQLYNFSNKTDNTIF